MEDNVSREDTPSERHTRLLRLRLDSDLKIAQSPIGGVVLQLRQRASRARGRAFVFLGTLVFTVVAGLAFYLGLPFWQIYSDGSKRALEGEKTHIEAQQTKLDGERGQLLDHSPKADQAPPDFGGLVQVLKEMPEELVSETQIGSALGWIVNGSEIEVLADSGVWYSNNGGTTYNRVIGPWPTVCCFRGKIVQSRYGPLVVGDRGLVALAHSLNQPFTNVDLGVPGYIGDLSGELDTSDASLIFGNDGGVFRAAGTDLSFSQVTIDPAGNTTRFAAGVQLRKEILLFGDNGAVFQSGDDGKSFLKAIGDLEYNSAQIFGGVATTNAIVIFGAHGAVFRSTDEGKNFQRVGSGSSAIDADFYDGAIAGDSIVLYGVGGAIFRSTDDGASFSRTNSDLGNIQGQLVGRIFTNDALVLFGPGVDSPPAPNASALTRSTDDGMHFLALPSASRYGPLQAGDLNGVPVLLTQVGTIIRFDDEWSNAFSKLKLAPGTDGDTALRQALDDQKAFPTLYSTWLPVVALSNELNKLMARRANDADQIKAIDDQIATLDNTPFSILSGTRAQQDFASFMQTCRDTSTHPVTGAEYASLTQSCLEAHGKVDDQAGGAWWSTLSRQLPAGILLMFMLVTLGALYRYNLRLAAFHDSRADVLELVASGSTPETLRQILQTNPGDILNRLTLAFGADKIDAGSIRMKLAEAEIALAETAVRLDAAADPK